MAAGGCLACCESLKTFLFCITPLNILLLQSWHIYLSLGLHDNFDKNKEERRLHSLLLRSTLILITRLRGSPSFTQAAKFLTQSFPKCWIVSARPSPNGGSQTTLQVCNSMWSCALYEKYFVLSAVFVNLTTRNQ